MKSQAIRTSMSDNRKEDWLTNVPLYAIAEIQKLVNPGLGGEMCRANAFKYWSKKMVVSSDFSSCTHPREPSVLGPSLAREGQSRALRGMG
jgi:hypothetical protein